MTQAWLSKLDALKAEAREKKTPLTPESLAQLEQVELEGNRLLAQGVPFSRACAIAVAKAGNPVRGAVCKVRGWRLGLSLDEHVKIGWTWHLSVSGGGTRADLERLVTHLGGDYHNPISWPAMTGHHVTHWEWPCKEAS